MNDRDVTVPAHRAELVRALFAAIDGGDVEALVAMFSPDAAQRIGNREWKRGRAGIRAGNTALLASVAGLSHQVTGLWEAAGNVIVRSEVRYDLLDGSGVTIPALTVFTVGPDGLIDTYQVWSDLSPLAAPTG